MRGHLFNILSLICLTVLQGCIPAPEKGLSYAMIDTSIANNVRSALYKYDTDVYNDVSVSVEWGDVLLTGFLKHQAKIDKATSLAWKVRGVKNVYNHITLSKDDTHIKQKTADSYATTAVKTYLIGAEDVLSANYAVTTHNNVVYLLGYARTMKEYQTVLDVTKKASKGKARKVVSYIRVKTPTL